VFAALLALAACLDRGVTDTAVVERIDLSPPVASVEAGRTLPLAAVARDAAGAALGGRPITWSSSNAQVATVSSAGVVTARSVGDARIAASAGGRSAVSTITVTAREVASVEITPVAISLRVGRTTSLQARALDAEGQPLTDRTITWSSGNPSIATVTSQGVVTAVAPGATTITATSDGRTGQAAVTITPEPVATVTLTPTLDTLAVGGTRTFTTTLRDVDGALLAARPIAWSVNNATVATVSSTGDVIALAPGTVTISAVSEGRVGQATVVVLERFANAVTLTPNSGTLQVGAELTLQAQVTDPAGTLLPDRIVSFSSDAPQVATVTATGLVTARAPGVARITASNEGKTAEAVITVVPVAVTQVDVTPLVSDVLVGSARQLLAVARSATGAVLTGRDITWTSGAPGIASVNAAGVVSGLAPGIAVMAATIDGQTGFATVTVRPRVVTTVQLTPTNPSIVANGSVQLQLAVRDQAGAPLGDRAVVYTSSDETIAFVSSTGLVIGVRAGEATITATVEGVSGSTLVTVR
jgi:trimeric autotransporter adhesin